MSFLVADPVVVAGLLDRQIASPSVRVHGAARLNAVLEKRDQQCSLQIDDVAGYPFDSGTPKGLCFG